MSLHILESPKYAGTWSERNWNEEGNQNLLRFNLSRAVDFKDCTDSAQQGQSKLKFHLAEGDSLRPRCSHPTHFQKMPGWEQCP